MHPIQVGAVLVAVIVTGGLAACLGPGVHARDVYVLDLRLMDLDPAQDPRQADIGAHCRTAVRNEDRIDLVFAPFEDPRKGPWLAVFPKLPPHWYGGLGNAPYVRALSSEIVLSVDEERRPLGRLDRDGRSSDPLRLDGAAIVLPHRWDVTAADGTWRVEATLDAWRGEVITDRHDGCD